MYSEISVYQGFSCEAIGRVCRGDINVNAYITTGNPDGIDVTDFYLISFSLSCRSEKVAKKEKGSGLERVVKYDKYRVLIQCKNPDFYYVMKPGVYMHIKGVPKISQSVAQRFGSPLYIQADSYCVMRAPDSVDPDTGEVHKSFDHYVEPPRLSYFIRTLGPGGLTPYQRARDGFEPNNINKSDRIKNEVISDDSEFREDFDF